MVSSLQKSKELEFMNSDELSELSDFSEFEDDDNNYIGGDESANKHVKKSESDSKKNNTTNNNNTNTNTKTSTNTNTKHVDKSNMTTREVVEQENEISGEEYVDDDEGFELITIEILTKEGVNSADVQKLKAAGYCTVMVST
ncbi:hypothetical protein AX774_g3000 [Zancudomyces culisetae]|uniref:Uncharacterized protein n=1 Tax=Zancudomyces culisetae TaxID=1213189 RepID=A0A1R1PRB0_ZANCU|nr:hypothetical protein AX774_g3000 [Zancudomyces culisetae]|eukprot:OMH83488.1 hypothetical protein AX774_g3000 [Zancudomyces culisetae]